MVKIVDIQGIGTQVALSNNNVIVSYDNNKGKFANIMNPNGFYI